MTAGPRQCEDSSSPGRTTVLGIGSPHGDDQVAWLLVDRLEDRAEIPVAWARLAGPSHMLDHVDGCSRLIIIDCCESGAGPGEITRLSWPDPRIARQHSHSSHGFGIAEMLALAEQLGRLPSEVILYGIEKKHCSPGMPLSVEVTDGLAKLEHELLGELC